MSFTDAFRYTGKRVRLANLETKTQGPFQDKDEGKAFTHECLGQLRDLQYRLFVEQKQSLLVVLQAPDAAGKDGVIRKVLGNINAQGVSTHPFKVPSTLERSHDFLWRVHAQAPAAGRIAIFNRSHYEDVLVVRVENLVTKDVWRKRYDHINHFETMLSDSNTRIIKIYLNISRREQLSRFKARLDQPEKHWKLNLSDYEARSNADAYRTAYEDVFTKCASERAPWYIIPADRKWFRDAAVANIMLETLQSMDPQLPPVEVDLDQIRALYEAELAQYETPDEEAASENDE